MMYVDFVDNALQKIILVDNDNMWYLDPQYRYQLFRQNLFVEDIQDFKITTEELKEIALLQIQLHNSQQSKSKKLADWAYNIINTQISPEMLSQAKEYATQIIEARQIKEQLEDKEKQLAQKQDSLSKKETVKSLFPGMNFAKKEL